MSLPLEFNRFVQGEIDEGFRYYEQLRTGLGTDFLDEVERVLGVIASHPELYGFAEDDIREAILNRFPYATCYRALPDRTHILSVHNAHRDLSRWRSRS